VHERQGSGTRGGGGGWGGRRNRIAGTDTASELFRKCSAARLRCACSHSWRLNLGRFPGSGAEPATLSDSQGMPGRRSAERESWPHDSKSSISLPSCLRRMAALDDVGDVHDPARSAVRTPLRGLAARVGQTVRVSMFLQLCVIGDGGLEVTECLERIALRIERESQLMSFRPVKARRLVDTESLRIHLPDSRHPVSSR